MLFNLILMRANHSVGADIPFAHYGHKEQIMKNDKLTNEQQAQNKSNLKKRAGYAWELFKWGIRLFDLVTRALDYLEGVVSNASSLVSIAWSCLCYIKPFV